MSSKSDATTPPPPSSTSTRPTPRSPSNYPGADLSGEELSVRVVPKQADEFTCSTCFLVHHRHRYAGERAGLPICRDCAA